MGQHSTEVEEFKEPGRLNVMDENAVATAFATADEVVGYDLIKDDILDALAGVPFLMTRITFRQQGTLTFLSAECIIGPADMLKRRRVDTAQLPFEPGELVVFNDGGTGIYRQIVAYLHARQYLTIPEPVIPGGKSGISTYDLPLEEWGTAGWNINSGSYTYTADGHPSYTAEVRLLAKRGIRISDYNWSGGPAKTRYLA